MITPETHYDFVISWRNYPIAERALCFASGAHGAINQRRKYTNEPYMNHPKRVAAILVYFGIEDDQTIATALLHDVLEDTQATAMDIIDAFKTHRSTIYHLVTDLRALTNVPDKYGVRYERKLADRRRLREATLRAQNVKCADIIDNAPGILKLDPKFGELYLQEVEETLKVLDKANKELREHALDIIKMERRFNAVNPQSVDPIINKMLAIKKGLQLQQNNFAVPMIDAIITECGRSEPYKKSVEVWLRCGDTFKFLREKICSPFRNAQFVNDYSNKSALKEPYYDICCAIESAKNYIRAKNINEQAA